MFSVMGSKYQKAIVMPSDTTNNTETVDLFIPENTANQIVGEYKARLKDDIKHMLRELDARLDDGDVVFARRTALLNVLELIDQKNWYRAYKICGMPPLEERTWYDE